MEKSFIPEQCGVPSEEERTKQDIDAIRRRGDEDLAAALERLGVSIKKKSNKRHTLSNNPDPYAGLHLTRTQGDKPKEE